MLRRRSLVSINDQNPFHQTVHCHIKKNKSKREASHRRISSYHCQNPCHQINTNQATMSEQPKEEKPQEPAPEKLDFLVADRTLRPEGAHFEAESGAGHLQPK